MIFRRGFDGSDPIDGDPVTGPADLHQQQVASPTLMATGTLACPACDAPVTLPSRVVSPADPLACPFCDHAGRAREFISLRQPTRPTRIELHVVRTRRVTR